MNFNQIFKFLTAVKNAVPSSHYVLLSLFFFAGLEVIFLFHRFIPVLAITVLALLVLGIILIRSEEGGRFHPTQIILPTVGALGLIGFGLFLPADMTLQFYFLGCALLFFAILKYGAKQAYPTWNWVLSHVVLFLAMSTILGWRFHLYIPVMAVITSVFAVFFLMSLQSLQRLVPATAEAVLMALCAAFVITQTAWALQFLPLHFLVQAGVLTAIYYVLFHLATVSYERPLTKQDILEYSTVGCGALLLILTTAQWT